MAEYTHTGGRIDQIDVEVVRHVAITRSYITLGMQSDLDRVSFSNTVLNFEIFGVGWAQSSAHEPDLQPWANALQAMLRLMWG